MAALIIRRTLGSLIVFLIVLLILYFALHQLAPGLSRVPLN
jgi:fumarate reductase subunit D